MCIAAPGRIVEITDDTAIIEYGSNKISANIGIVDAQAGDWVLVHAGLVIQVLPEDEAKAMLELFSELEDLAQ